MCVGAGDDHSDIPFAIAQGTLLCQPIKYARPAAAGLIPGFATHFPVLPHCLT